jgi:hypothetical protein
LATFIQASKTTGYVPDDLLKIIENLIREHIIYEKMGGADNAI